jgi:hypothetical protein
MRLPARWVGRGGVVRLPDPQIVYPHFAHPAI